jgi:hypothetical protein
MGKEEQRFVIKYLWIKGSGAKKIHEEVTNTLGDDASGPSQIKIWPRGSTAAIYPAGTFDSPVDHP